MANDARKRPRGARGAKTPAPEPLPQVSSMRRSGQYHRPAIFRNKKVRVQGLISKAGAEAFEQRRQQLGKLSGWDAKKISDADTIEYLARGEIRTKLYLKGYIAK